MAGSHLAVLAALAVATAAPARAQPPARAAVTAADLLAPWSGPHGLPPTSNVDAATLDTAYRSAIAAKRNEVKAIAANKAPPSFANTVLALERSGAALDRVQAIYAIYAATKSDDSVRAVAGKLAAARQALDDEIALDPALFARIDAVVRAGKFPDADARRLTELTRANMVRRGALLDAAGKAKLVALNSRIAELQQIFGQNLGQDEARMIVTVRDEARLAGLPEDQKEAARAAARERALADAWVIRNTRPAVWGVAKFARDRGLRQEVWAMWMGRGAQAGATDNRPITSEILKLRGEKARLFGFANFADFAFDGRMVKSPKAALGMLEGVWRPVAKSTRARLAEMRKIADADGMKEPIKPWDLLFYSERLRQQRFGYDSKSVEPYFQVPKLLEGMMWAAQRTYGYSFEKLRGVDVVSPDIDVYRVRRNGATAGYVYVDLYRRDGKQRGSWASQYRIGRKGSVLPVVALHSNAEHGADGRPATVDYEVANVLFHEFGHILHTLSTTSPYAGTGSLAVPWDFVEVPSLLNERYLLDPAILSRFALHRDSGAPMPAPLADTLRAVAKFDRIFSLNLEYLATAIVDLRLHLLADGRAIDVAATEAAVLREIGMPEAVDPTMRALHSYHTFSGDYAAGVYTYLWSDMLAADIGERFAQAPGGFYDADVARAYFDTILSRGARVPTEQAFREFRGRDPDQGALMRRFGLESDE